VTTQAEKLPAVHLCESAFDAIKQAILLSPPSPRLQLRCIHIAHQAQQFDKMLQEVQRFKTLFPADSLQHMLATYLSEHTGKNIPIESGKFSASLQKRIDKNVDMYEIAQGLFVKGHYEKAISALQQALALHPQNTEARKMLTVALSVCSHFPRAAQHAFMLWQQTHDFTMLQAAALLVGAYDAQAFAVLYKNITTSDQYTAENGFLHLVDSPGNSTFFKDQLRYLNFAYNEIEYKKHQNRALFFSKKARLFYSYNMLDSAVYYDLNTLRSADCTYDLSRLSLYNLAAGYFETGQYLLSYLRFLDLSRFRENHRDPLAHLGLALNYEQFGDISRALKHYRKAQDFALHLQTSSRRDIYQYAAGKARALGTKLRSATVLHLSP